MIAPRVLVVAPEYPWPPRSGGTRRLRALLSALGLAFEVHVVLVRRSDLTKIDPPPADFADSTTVLIRSRSRFASVIEMARGIPSGQPLGMAHYTRPVIARELAAASKAISPDVVIACWLGGARLVEGVVDPSRIILDLDNAEHSRLAMMSRTDAGVRRLMWRVDAVLTRRWMARNLRHFGAVALSSEDDVRLCAEVAHDARYIVVENGVDLTRTPRADPGGASLLLLGDLGYAPNRDALAWFVKEVLPRCPSVAEVRVVGGGAAARSSEKDGRVRAVGFVQDVSIEFDRATALVAPLRAGAGTRLKILEAMAAGVPVISTSVGAAGLAAQPDTHLLVADDAPSFAESTERLLRDYRLRTQLSTNGRQLVEDRYEWSSRMRPLVRAVEEVASKVG